MTAAGHALAVSGNHEDKLVRALRGRKVQVSHGLETTLAQLAAEPDDERRAVLDFCDGLVAHLVLDDGRLVVAHAGLKEEYHGRASGRVRSLRALRRHHGRDRRVRAAGPLPVGAGLPRPSDGALRPHADARAGVGQQHACASTPACVFGGRLTALRYPEREVVPVDAERVWYEPASPFPAVAEARADDDLAITDVLGARVVETGPPRPRHRPRRAGRRRARGDEPVRAAPALAAVPAADDGAGRDARRARTCSSTPTRRSRRSRPSACRRWCARRSTWARAPWCWCAATRRSPRAGSAASPGGPARSTRAPAGRSSTTT